MAMLAIFDENGMFLGAVGLGRMLCVHGRTQKIEKKVNADPMLFIQHFARCSVFQLERLVRTICVPGTHLLGSM